jgi:hypothetical protein
MGVGAGDAGRRGGNAWLGATRRVGVRADVLLLEHAMLGWCLSADTLAAVGDGTQGRAVELRFSVVALLGLHLLVPGELEDTRDVVGGGWSDHYDRDHRRAREEDRLDMNRTLRCKGRADHQRQHKRGYAGGIGPIRGDGSYNTVCQKRDV